jgi:hypothetical protein
MSATLPYDVKYVEGFEPYVIVHKSVVPRYVYLVLEILLEINVSSVAHTIVWATEETLISNRIS